MSNVKSLQTNFLSESFAIEKSRPLSYLRSQNGNFVANAYGNILQKPKISNKKIEDELLIFKKEIEEKYLKSTMNTTYVFPRLDKIKSST